MVEQRVIMVFVPSLLAFYFIIGMIWVGDQGDCFCDPVVQLGLLESHRLDWVLFRDLVIIVYKGN